MEQGTQNCFLYLIPTLLGGDDVQRCVPDFNINIINKLRYFVVEEIRSARRFLRKVSPQFPIDECQFRELNEHTKFLDSNELLAPLSEGHSIGVLSEAGLPCVADPGANLVLAAQDKGIKVVPLVGASSIFTALMASGLSGQQFVFHGYLPKEKGALVRQIKKMESDSSKNSYAQIFIETPYKNNSLWETLLDNCQNETHLCVGANITLENEYIVTKTIADWKKANRPDLHKQLALFILQRTL